MEWSEDAVGWLEWSEDGECVGRGGGVKVRELSLEMAARDRGEGNRRAGEEEGAVPGAEVPADL